MLDTAKGQREPVNCRLGPICRETGHVRASTYFGGFPLYDDLSRGFNSRITDLLSQIATSRVITMIKGLSGLLYENVPVCDGPLLT